MKKRWIALLLACALTLGVMGAFAAAADEEKTEEKAEPTVIEVTEDGAVTVQQDDAGTLSFGSIHKRVLEHNYTALSLGETIAMLNEIDYKKLENQVRDGLNEIADMQWNLTAGSVSSPQMEVVNIELGRYAMGGNESEKVFATAIMGLQTSMGMLQSAFAESTNAQLQAQYDATKEQLDDIKNGKLQADNEGVILQLKTAQNQMVMAAETLYITLLGLERSDAALTRSLNALDRTLNEMNLRYQLGQISSLQLQQVTAGRAQLVSGQKTLQMNIDLLRMQLNALLGEELDAVLTLQPIDTVSEEHLTAMNLAKDLEKSEAASYEVYAAKKALDDAEETYKDAEKEYGKNSKKMEFTQAKHTWQAAQYTYEAAMQSYEMKFRSQYAKVKDYAQILTAAQANLNLEQAEYNAAALKYQQGTISSNALKTASDELQEAKDSVATAQSDLYSSYITYQWAVQNGILN